MNTHSETNMASQNGQKTDINSETNRTGKPIDIIEEENTQSEKKNNKIKNKNKQNQETINKQKTTNYDTVYIINNMDRQYQGLRAEPCFRNNQGN